MIESYIATHAASIFDEDRDRFLNLSHRFSSASKNTDSVTPYAFFTPGTSLGFLF